MKFRFPIVIIDEDYRSENTSGLGIRALAQAIETAGANLISTHFCWHEAPVPTIATMVPRAAFTEVTGRLRQAVSVPLITSNMTTCGCSERISM